MRAAELLLMLTAMALPACAIQAAPAAAKASADAPTAPSDQRTNVKLRQEALKFVEAADARQRLAENLDKLLEDGKQSMMERNPGLDPQFAEEWVKRMRTHIRLDDFVDATAGVYANYFTGEELEELTQAQMGLKSGRIHTLPPELAEKLKSDSAKIQHDINAATSALGARVSMEVGKEIEREHPEWIKAPGPASSSAAKK
jgi:hypothetical protein